MLRNKSEQKLLTILLPIKDNSRMTLRWLNYALKNNFEFKIFIADGGEKKFYINKKFKKNLDLEYKYFGYDNSHYKYISKIKKSIHRIKTKYCLLADNDDFYIKETIFKSLSFMENNLDYSSCGGNIFKFTLSDRIKGKITYTTFSKQNSYLGSSKDRLENLSVNFNEIYYDITRTTLMKKFTSDFLKYNKRKFNYFFFPMTMSYYLLAKGKVKKFDDIMLLRQEDYQSSTSSGLISPMKAIYDEYFSFNLINAAVMIHKNINENLRIEFIRSLLVKTITELLKSMIISNKENKISFQNYFKSIINNNNLFLLLKKLKYHFSIKKLAYSKKKLMHNLIIRVE